MHTAGKGKVTVQGGEGKIAHAGQAWARARHMLHVIQNWQLGTRSGHTIQGWGWGTGAGKGEWELRRGRTAGKGHGEPRYVLYNNNTISNNKAIKGRSCPR